MNKLKLFLAAVLLTFSTTLTYAIGTNPTTEPAVSTSELRAEIYDLISKLDIDKLGIKGEEKVTIEFIVTDDSKIVVTKTSNIKLDATVKYLLNYKSISTNNITKNEKYILPIVLKK